ncbi:MAG: FAD-dependent oxidoreductase [Bacteroidetes bacterium]|nr:FAD-dependent oxidoreductase [Bacteroidota bacterium]
MISVFDRPREVSELQNEVFDLIVIGGGATGAGILLDAASRGMKTLLLEQEDFAWGTSSRSTKLIHGGLRYLKQLEISLVREVGKERAILHANAPHLVHPEELLLPLIESGSLGKYTTPVGLWMYEKLAGVPKEERFKTLSREEARKAEPLLNSAILQGAAIYREYRTDDARLVTSLLKTAARLGGQSLNYASVEGFLYDDAGAVCGVKVQDRIGRKAVTFKSHAVVNAAGPWCDEVRRLDSPVKGKHLQLTKGVHLVFSRERFPLKRSVYFDVPDDGRMVFAIKRGNTTYLGTTDTLYDQAIGHPRTLAADVVYLLNAANRMFPTLQLELKDVQSSWAGLRPLIHEEGKGPSELSRKDEVFQTDSGLISIAGGKLTGYRIMAERIVDMVMIRRTAQGAGPYRESKTENLPLAGGDFENYTAVARFKQRLFGESRQVEASTTEIDHLVNCYGTEATAVLERAYALHPEEMEPRWRMLRAELDYCLSVEGVCTLSDFLIRRTGRLYFDRDSLEPFYPAAAQYMAEKMNWTRERMQAQLAEFEQAYFEALSFPEQK